MKIRTASLVAVFGLASCLTVNIAQAAFDDLTEWTLVQDPADPSMTATVTSSMATLGATGSIPAATDIGFASVDGLDVASSSQGYYFLPDEDFYLAMDFDFSSVSSLGGSGFGFGIGEDADGKNSVGVAASVLSGNIAGYFGVSRTEDTDSTPILLDGFTGTTARMEIDYDSDSGDVLVGIRLGRIGFFTHTFTGIQNDWDDKPLLVSFFLRSDDTLGAPLTSGSVQVIFEDVVVIGGSPIAIPEPTSFSLLLLGVMAATRRR